jgi:hypothetical protein
LLPAFGCCLNSGIFQPRPNAANKQTANCRRIFETNLGLGRMHVHINIYSWDLHKQCAHRVAATRQSITIASPYRTKQGTVIDRTPIYK